jgi:hypothetical protein
MVENVTGCRKAKSTLKMCVKCHYPNGLDSTKLRTVYKYSVSTRQLACRPAR